MVTSGGGPSIFQENIPDNVINNQKLTSWFGLPEGTPAPEGMSYYAYGSNPLHWEIAPDEPMALEDYLKALEEWGKQWIPL